MTFDEKQILRQSYNNHAEERDQTQIQDWKFDEREQFLKRILDEGARSILEIGAGTGRDSLYFQQRGLDVTCIDLSEEMVRLCEAKGLQARCMNFQDLDFAPNSFDAVYAQNCLLHVPKAKIEQVLDQVSKVLKPNGLFFYGVYGGQDSEGIWEQDRYEPKRFFSFYEDEALLQVVQRKFFVEDFHTVDMGEGQLHFQSMLLRNA